MTPMGTVALVRVRDAGAREPLRALLADTFGFEALCDGGGFFAVFETATDALRFSLEALATGGGSAFGVHVGDPDVREEERGTQYGGGARLRVERIAAAARDGQILVSERAWREGARARDSLGAPVVTDLGELRLAGLEAPERLFDVRRMESAAIPVPAPLALDGSKTNLAAPAASFVGREAELAGIESAFLNGAGLVTLHGAGGMGKTRLATRYGALALVDLPGGVWVSDLAEARTPDGVCAAVARGIGATLATCSTVPIAVDALAAAMAARGRALFLFDGVDPVTRPLADMVARWISAAPDARFLVTSREPLGVAGERARLLEPLAPGDALRLLSKRSRAVDAELSEVDARPAWSELTRRLDGIPLALELVAARASSAAPARLLEWARAHLPLPSGTRDAADHAATVATTLATIWETLEEAEQFGLAQCSIFRGGFSLEAAEDVLDVSRFEDAPSSVDLVQSLWDRGLLRAWEPAGFAGELRFALPAPILVFAAEKLDGFRYRREATSHHALHYLDAAEEWAAAVEDPLAIPRLALELENVASVLQASLAEEAASAESAGDALRAVLALEPLLSTAGPRHVRVAWMDASLALAVRANADSVLLAEVRRRREQL